MKTRLVFWSLLVLAVGASGSWAAEKACLWDLDSLYQVPKATWGEQDGLVREVYYEGEPVAGKPTRVFGYYATPAKGNGPFPAMVLVHGGGGTAFREWAELWARRGYAALAMDLAGHGPDKKRLPDGGPDQGDIGKYSHFDRSDYRKMWTYHAVAAVIRGHSLLASREEVDARRTGICGISWGGYLTCITAGIDHRFKVAVPVYGCGFLDENSVWLPFFNKMTPELRRRWVKYFDPSGYLSDVECPIFFLAGTDDLAYPMDIHRKSCQLVPARGPIDLRIQVHMPHGHWEGWAPKEIGLYVDSVLKNGKPLPRLGPLEVKNGKATATIENGSTIQIKSAALHWTTDKGGYRDNFTKWKNRQWHAVDATVENGQISAEIPSKRPITFFLEMTDDRDATTSTHYAELP